MRALMFQNCVKFLVLGPHTPTPAPMGVKIGAKESSTLNYMPIGATCRLFEAKNLIVAP